MRRGGGLKRLLTLAVTALLVVCPAIVNQNRASASDTSILFNRNELDSLTEHIEIRPKTALPRIYSQAYLLLDADTSTTLLAKNADQPVAIASTTKMATAIVARELFSLDQILTVPKQVGLIPGSDIQLQVGEKMTAHDLLRGLLIQSGNDAAYTLAYSYSADDSYQPFVAKMNDWATEHHLKATHYGDPAGLDDETGRSTAADLANVARLLLRDPVLAEIVATPTTMIHSADGAFQHELKNSNRLVVGDSGLYLPNVTGVKTGFTPAAGHCLVASYRTNRRFLIGVILNTDEYTITASASEMRKLFTWADSGLVVDRY